MQTNNIILQVRSVFTGYGKYFMNELSKRVQEMSVDEMKGLLLKYAPLLETVTERGYLKHLAYVFDVALAYISRKYPALNTDRKTWAFVCLKHLLLNGSLKREQDVYDNIDDFFKYYENHYEDYLADIEMSSSEYDRDAVFLRIYLKEKTVA